MRVVVVSAWEPWRISDGAVLPLHHHLHHLRDRHELTVLAAGSRSAREQQATLPDGLPVRWFGTDRGKLLDFVVRRIGSELRGEPAHVSYVERPALLAALAQASRDADLLYLAGWGTAQLAARGSIPAVHYAVDPWAASMTNRLLPPVRRLAEAGQRRLTARHERRHYPRAGAVVVVSPDDAGQLRREAPAARIEVVANGVETGADAAALPADDVIGFHGAFETRANVDGALALVERIWPRVRVAAPNARVLLAGRAPPPLIRRLAGGGVEVRADVPDVRAEIDRMAVYVAWMPSGHGMKNKVLEAMAAGRPVVANARALSGIGPGDGVIAAADEAAAAEAVSALLRDRVEANRIGAAGRRRMLAEFTWEASAAALEAVWQSVAGQ